MKSGISRRTTTTVSSVATGSSSVSTAASAASTTFSNVYRSRPSTLIPPPLNKVTLKASDDKKMVGTVKPSTIRRPSSRETLCVGNNNRMTNGGTNGFNHGNSTSIKESSRLNKIDVTPAPTRITKPSNQIGFSASTTTKKLTNGVTNGFNRETAPRTDSKLNITRNEVNSSVRKSVAPSLNANNNKSTINTAKKAGVGTASARAATTLISLQKECDKYKKLADLYKRQLDASKGDVSKSVMVVDGLSVVVKYLTEHLNAFSTPSLKSTIERQASNYEKLKGDYSKLESLLEQMRQENTRKEDDLKDEIVRMSLEVVNEKKRHDNEKNRLFDMFDEQMKVEKKAFTKELQKVEEEKSGLEKVIDSLKDEIKDKMRQIEGLTNRVSELESSLSMEKDRRCRMLQEKVKFMTSEIQSLKDVLDLKDGELRTLKTSIANEELLRQDLVTAQQSIVNLTQRLEQLEISANQKNAMINMLKEENESLRERYNKEQRERRRISMKNEELEYTLSEFTTPSKANSSSMDEDVFLTPMQPPPRSRLTLASVPPLRPHSTDSIRKARTSYSVARPNHHHSKCFKPSLPPSSPPFSPATSTSSTLPCSTSLSSLSSTAPLPNQSRRHSASVKLTFQDANAIDDINNHYRNYNTHSDGVYNLPDSDDEDDDNYTATTPNIKESNVYSVNPSTRNVDPNNDCDNDDKEWQQDEDDSFHSVSGAINISSGNDSTCTSSGLNATLVESQSPSTNNNINNDLTSSSSASSSTNGEGTSGIGSSINSISAHSVITQRSERSEDDSEAEAPKSLPSILPQSILDSGFEDIEGLIAFR